MTEDKKKELSDAAATIIAAVIGVVGGIIIAFIGVKYSTPTDSSLQELRNQNETLQNQNETLQNQRDDLQAQLAQTIPAPKGSDAWTDQNGVKHRYWVCNGFPEWEKAETFCENLGGHLATILSAEEQAHIGEYVKANVPVTCLWFGIQENNGNWNQWVSGDSLEYAHWGASYPRFNVSYVGVLFSNYETLTNTLKSANQSVINRGEWFQVPSTENAIERLNPDGWLICEWDY